MNVVCVGDCGVDHYLPSGDQRFGGITANFARHARDQFAPDDRVQIVSCVGNDDGAELVLTALESTDIECRIAEIAGATPVQYIEVAPDGERQFVRYDEGVLRDFRFSNEQRSIISGGDLVVAPVYLQIVGLFDDLMSINTEGLIAIDFADFLQHPDFELLESHIEKIDLGFFGLRKDDSDTIGMIEGLARQHDKVFIVTLGPDGSVAFTRDGACRSAAAPVDVIVDTTGAGDAFAAAFLSRYCKRTSLQQSLTHAARVASTVVAHLGSYDTRNR